MLPLFTMREHQRIYCVVCSGFHFEINTPVRDVHVCAFVCFAQLSVGGDLGGGESSF